jgi:ribulose-5-phosphate 4-epimerase/fuculose-1-phosphate aldolase
VNDILKKDLANAYKILGHLGWDDHTYTHLSVRSAKGDSFYIYPFGFLFHEVEPHLLLKVSLDGEVLEGTEYSYNETAYIIHGPVYKERPDINAVFHIHTPSIAAVSACEKGLLPLSQWALHFYNKMAYHNYNSLNLEETHSIGLVRDLQEKFVMLLRNHGSLTCGKTVQEAMFYTYHLQKACQTQCLALSMNQDLILPPTSICEEAVNDLLKFEENLGMRDWLAWLRLIEKNTTLNAKAFSLYH